MKRTVQSILLAVFVSLTTAYSCAQNGPTKPTVTLTITNAGTGITANCFYRGTTPGGETLPGICVAATSSYTDTSAVAGQTYYYEATEQIGSAEGAYSNELKVVVPSTPPAPTLGVGVVTKNEAVPLAPQPVPVALVAKAHSGATLTAKVEWKR